MTPNQLPPLPEPDGQMTVTFGLDEKRKVPVFFGDRLTAYALAAIAQQAQEPVAWVCKSGHGTVFRESITPELASLEHGGRKVWTPIYTTPPAPQVPAPVDERHRAVALELDRLMLVIESAVRWQDPTHHAAVLSLLKANRAALQSPAPQTKGGES